MAEYKAIVMDGTEIALDGYTSAPLHFWVVKDTTAEALASLDTLTISNLARVEVAQDGEIVNGWSNCQLTGVQLVANVDGGWTGHYYLDGTVVGTTAPASEMAAEYETAYKILMGEEV